MIVYYIMLYCITLYYITFYNTASARLRLGRWLLGTPFRHLGVDAHVGVCVYFVVGPRPPLLCKDVKLSHLDLLAKAFVYEAQLRRLRTSDLLHVLRAWARGM